MDKQLFAKIGVFLLLGVNVAAYYVFWPSPQGAPKTEARGPREEKGEAILLPSSSEVAKPKVLPPNAFKDAVLVSLPAAPRLPEQEIKADDAVNKLLDHIKKEPEAAQVGIPQPMTPFFEEKKNVVPERIEPSSVPKPLPPLQADPVMKDPNIGVTSALTSKPLPPLDGAWQFQTQLAKPGGQTLVIAKLRSGVEFRFCCDRFDRTSVGDAAVAIGGVTCIGAALSVSCQRMTLPLGPAQLVFEGQVLVAVPGVGFSALRMDRAVWDFPELVPKAAVLGAPK